MIRPPPRSTLFPYPTLFRSLNRRVARVRRFARDGSLDGVNLELERLRDKATLRLDPDLPRDGDDRRRPEGVVLIEDAPREDRARESQARRCGGGLVGEELGDGVGSYTRRESRHGGDG